MAFGIEHLRKAVDSLTQHVNDLGTSIRDGISDARTLVLDAVAHTRSDITGRVDDTRSDLGGRIDDTRRNVDKLTREIGAARREIAELHAFLRESRAEAAEPRTATAQDPESATTPTDDEPSPDSPQSNSLHPPTSRAMPLKDRSAGEDDREKHLGLMQTAAGISQAEFTCHRDLWAFFLRKAANEPHFHIPGCVGERDGNVHTMLSGPTLLAALTAMWEVQRQAADGRPPSGDWALSKELYGAVADAVGAVCEKPRHRDKQKVAIVIDRQPGDGDTDSQ